MVEGERAVCVASLLCLRLKSAATFRVQAAPLPANPQTRKPLARKPASTQARTRSPAFPLRHAPTNPHPPHRSHPFPPRRAPASPYPLARVPEPVSHQHPATAPATRTQLGPVPRNRHPRAQIPCQSRKKFTSSCIFLH